MVSQLEALSAEQTRESNWDKAANGDKTLTTYHSIVDKDLVSQSSA